MALFCLLHFIIYKILKYINLIGKQLHCFPEKVFITSLKNQTFTKYLLARIRRNKNLSLYNQVKWHQINFFYMNRETSREIEILSVLGSKCSNCKFFLKICINKFTFEVEIYQFSHCDVFKRKDGELFSGERLIYIHSN